MKAFYFLTDVAEDEGPFVYVPGSHRLTPERLAWEHEQSIGAADERRQALRARLAPRHAAEISRGWALRAPRAFAVPANTLVVADTVGFHARGLSARPTRAGRDLDLRAAQPVPALDGARPRQHARASPSGASR